jgi:hypothetical protein
VLPAGEGWTILRTKAAVSSSSDASAQRAGDHVCDPLGGSTVTGPSAVRPQTQHRSSAPNHVTLQARQPRSRPSGDWP